MLAERLLHDVRLHGAPFSTTQVHEWARRVIACVRQGLCAMRGHEPLLHVEPRRLSLRCIECGWQSPGWLIDRPRFSYIHGRSVRRDVRARVELPRAPSDGAGRSRRASQCCEIGGAHS